MKYRRFTTLALFAIVLVLGASLTGAASADVTGASASKTCPGIAAQLGETIHCTFTVENTGAAAGTIDVLTETSPFPGGTAQNISCVGTDAVTRHTGDALPSNVVCSGSFDVVVPNDPALCGGALRDRVEIDLSYPQFSPPLTAGAFATNTTAIICPPHIVVHKTADTIGKVGDPVTYTVSVQNTGNSTLNRVSVTDTLKGDITSLFPATLAAGATASVTYTRTVLASDPDPLVNTVTAVYSNGTSSDTESASASTNLFQPSVSVTKNCVPKPVTVGGTITCTIVISDTSSVDTPTLNVASISDTRSGDLRDAGNTNVVSSNCLASIASGGSCTIVTREAVTAADLPGPVVDSVSVDYHPTGFPNDVRGSARESVPINFNPDMTLTKGCAPANENIGDTTTYTFVVTNTGNVPLNLVSATDTLLGTLTGSFPATLAPGQTVTVTATRVVLATDPSPLPNTVTTVYSGLTTTLTRTANCSITINPPPGTAPLTIGFWKTHAPASCKQGNGNQADALTPALGTGITLGTYHLTDPCKAVQLLSKNNINGVKQPGDPIFNFVAQLVGVYLNGGNGATITCDGMPAALASAQSLLTAVHFNGVTHDPLTAAQAALANSLNTTFDSFNSNTLAGCVV